METKITIKRATYKDIDFIIETIIEADKSGTNKISYCNIFDINENEFRNILKNILEEDIDGNEFWLSGYLIAYINNQYAGACCSWIESIDGTPSEITKANILVYYIGSQKCLKAINNLKLIEKLNIKREPNTLQFESVYVKPEYRGNNIAGKLIKQHAINCLKYNNTIKKCQIIFADINTNAFNAYNKIGFTKEFENSDNNIEILELLPSNKRIMMTANIKTLIN